LSNKDYSNIMVCTSFNIQITRIPIRWIKRSFFMKIDIKAKSNTKHKNIIKAFHPTLRPSNRFINPVIHPQVQKKILNIF
jgi:hypothetical protein